jgi:hypothetical protein
MMTTFAGLPQQQTGNHSKPFEKINASFMRHFYWVVDPLSADTFIGVVFIILLPLQWTAE